MTIINVENVKNGERNTKRKLKDDYPLLIITLLYCVRAAMLTTKLYGRD